MSLGTYSPLPLNFLAAFSVLDANLDWDNERLDELSKSHVSACKEHQENFAVSFLRGKADIKKYISDFSRLVFLIKEYYEDPETQKVLCKDRKVCHSLFPPVWILDLLGKRPKAALFELLLFSDIFPIDKIHETAFEALCRDE